MPSPSPPPDRPVLERSNGSNRSTGTTSSTGSGDSDRPNRSTGATGATSSTGSSSSDRPNRSYGPNRSSRPIAPVVRAVAAGAATLLLTSCAVEAPRDGTTAESAAATQAPHAEPSPGGRTGLLAQRHTWGGMCPEGACRSTLTVAADGSWTWEDETGSDDGRLDPRALAQVRSAVAATRLDLATADDGVRCDADADGRSVRVAWAGTDGWTEVSSCEVQVDAADPLVEVLDDLAGRVAP